MHIRLLQESSHIDASAQLSLVPNIKCSSLSSFMTIVHIQIWVALSEMKSLFINHFFIFNLDLNFVIIRFLFTSFIPYSILLERKQYKDMK